VGEDIETVRTVHPATLAGFCSSISRTSIVFFCCIYRVDFLSKPGADKCCTGSGVHALLASKTRCLKPVEDVYEAASLLTFGHDHGAQFCFSGTATAHSAQNSSLEH